MERHVPVDRRACDGCELEANADAVRDELLALRESGSRSFQPYRAPSWAGKVQAEDGVGASCV
jgi:hypothetical protein